MLRNQETIASKVEVQGSNKDMRPAVKDKLWSFQDATQSGDQSYQGICEVDFLLPFSFCFSLSLHFRSQKCTPNMTAKLAKVD